MVPITEIEKNDYNLNIPRYIDSQEAEDIQDIEAHLLGDIPNHDVDELSDYWEVYPSLKAELFQKSSRKDYSALKIEKDEIKKAIFNHPEFTANSDLMDNVFHEWRTDTTQFLKGLKEGLLPKQVIHTISEGILMFYTDKSLLSKYDVYQHLLNYWIETMQDDLYEISLDGWKAGKEVTRLRKESKNNKKETVLKEVSGFAGLEGRLIPTELIIQVYFEKEQSVIHDLEAKKETVIAKMEELREENGGEEGLLCEVLDDKQKISRKNLQSRMKELGKKNNENREEWEILQQYQKMMDEESELIWQINEKLYELEMKVVEKYPTLSETEIKTIVVDHKWMGSIEKDVKTEMDRISQRLTQRIKELAERYEKPLPEMAKDVDELEKKVKGHLEKMGFRV